MPPTVPISAIATGRIQAAWWASALRSARRSLRRVLIAALVGSLAPHAACAGERWGGLTATVFHNYSVDQGLPHPVPTALAQDHNGFLWIGTQGGLARWDGYRFKAYRADAKRPGSLPDDWVQTLLVDSGGRLWIGTNAGHLAWYDGDRDRFVTVPLRLAPGRAHISAISDDGNGHLWIGTDDGLRHLTVATDAVTMVRAEPRLPSASVRSLLRDRTGALWVGTAAGLVRRAAGAGAFAPVVVDGTMPGISALFEEANGRIWIGTVRDGLFAVVPGGAAPIVTRAPIATDSNSISAICQAGPHLIWVALRSGGIVALDTQSGESHGIHHDRALSNSLAHDDIWALLTDNVGSVWVGGTGGLSYRPPNSGLISTIFGGQDRPGGPSGTDVLSILATRKKQVWLGYVDGGVDLIDPARGRIAALRPDPRKPGTALPRASVFSMAEAADGTVFIGTRLGLYATDPAGRAVRLVTVRGRDPHMAIDALLFDRGLLWIGGERDGLWAIRPSRMGITNSVVFGPPQSAKLANPEIVALVRGTGQDLWIATRNGLERLDLVTHAPTAPNYDAFAGRFVSALLIDRSQRLWVGTFGGGLAVMTGRGADGRPQFRHFGLADGLPHLNVDKLAMDGTGTIWASTDDGLSRIDPTTLAIRPVSRPDNAMLRDYFVGSGAVTPEGEVLFGARDGLTVVRPGPLPRWRFAPPIVITDLRVGGASQPSSPYNRAASTAPIVISPGSNSLSVEFAALDFTAPERNRYAYRLEGFDRGWTESDASRRLATYTNLPPGDYRLRLRGSNRDGRWSGRDLILPIHVLPASYQRLRFYIALSALLALGVAGIVRWRTAHLRRLHGKLEDQIGERTADLRAANDRLIRLTRIDTLTGCFNRRHFLEETRERIANAARHDTALSLIVLDLDEFKAVNDTFGHPAGDAVLTSTGVILSAHARSTDLVGRIGGEEFALAMPHTDAAGARLFAERLRKAISGHTTDVSGTRIRVTASFGIAQLRPQEDFDALYARADAALYAAKQAGRDRIEVDS